MVTTPGASADINFHGQIGGRIHGKVERYFPANLVLMQHVVTLVGLKSALKVLTGERVRPQAANWDIQFQRNRFQEAAEQAFVAFLSSTQGHEFKPSLVVGEMDGSIAEVFKQRLVSLPAD